MLSCIHVLSQVYQIPSTRAKCLYWLAPDERTARRDLLSGLYHERGQGVQREAGELCVGIVQTVAPETGGRRVRRTFTFLEPCNCKADSSELLTANEAGQEFTKKT